ncbi:DUF6343 family protein [Streptomyces sp. 4N509B]|uniref:DUF6343 family protein n=1 Tax=Streptomyces sp. 4N509B TaxID=3457413 RepID=UPI003FD39311
MPRIRHRQRTGSEPLTAYSDLRLRLLLSVIFTPLFVAGTVLLFVWWLNAEPDDAVSRGEVGVAAVICAVAAVIALVDLAVVLRRLRGGGQQGGPGGGPGGIGGPGRP